MLNIFLLLCAAFWGDTQVKEWGDIGARFGIGVPVSNRLNLVDFSLGISHFGIGTSVVESYGFVDGGQFIGSLLPLQVTMNIYQKIAFWKEEAFFDRLLYLKIRGSPWGQRYNGVSPLSFILSPDWEAKAPYISIEIAGRWSPIRMLGVEATIGTLIPKDAGLRVYLNISGFVGTSGPVSSEKVLPRLEISSVIFEDALNGNANGILDPGEQGRLLFLVSNKGLRDSDSIYLNVVMRDTGLEQYLSFEEITLPPLKASETLEASISVFAADRLPALPLRARIWGKDAAGNIVSPAFVEIPTAGS